MKTNKKTIKKTSWLLLLSLVLLLPGFSLGLVSVAAEENNSPVGPPPGASLSHESHPTAPIVLPSTILAEFYLPNPYSFFNGRSIAFDSQDLWANFAPGYNPEVFIYKVSTSGTLLKTLYVGVGIGALAWDSNENVLWGGSYDNQAMVYKIDPNTGAILTSFSVKTYFAGDPWPGYIDGMTYDETTDTLWLSSDVGNVVINIDKAGNLIQSFTFTGVSGNAFDGVNLWNAAIREQRIIQTDLSGNLLAEFATPGYYPEDLAFDPITFAPKCVVWSNEATFGVPRIRAWEVPCPGVPAPPPGSISGTVTLTCFNSPVAGVQIDLYYAAGPFITSTTTAYDGTYSFQHLGPGDYIVTIVTEAPLTIALGEESVPATVVAGEDTIVDFVLQFTLVDEGKEPRTIGYWKHQVNAWLTGKGKPQETRENLTIWLGFLGMNLEDVQAFLNIGKEASMVERAWQQLLALLLNVVSGKLATHATIDLTEFGLPEITIVSEATLYCLDNLAASPELVKDIADAINNGLVLL